jgi:DNA repair protein RadC
MDKADVVFYAEPEELRAYEEEPVPRRNAARRKKRVEFPVVASEEYEGLLVRTALVRSTTYREGKFMPSLRSLNDVARLLAHLASANQEYLVTIPVNSALVPLAVHETAIGSSRGATGEASDILRVVLLTAASAFVVAHNHPSGSPSPSETDIEMTEQLTKAGKCMGLSLLDHVVIGFEGFMSIKTRHRGGWGEL